VSLVRIRQFFGAMTRVRAIDTLGVAISNFIADGCFRYSAALSFYALFSIAPMVMVSVSTAGLLAPDVDFQNELIQQFTQLVGERGAEGVRVLLENMEDEATSRFRLVVSTAVLVFSATNMFIQLQAAFNVIYSVTVTGRGFLKLALDRLVSLGIILSLGLIMFISLVVDSLIVLLQGHLIARFPDVTVIFVSILQYAVMATLAGLELYALLHFLPDVHIPRRYKIIGCLTITTFLIVGKSLISWYIGTSNFSDLGGASSSVIVLMLWIYYSSLILFFGAEVIKALANADGVELEPRRYAAKVKKIVE
jgi:membrane protein